MDQKPASPGPAPGPARIRHGAAVACAILLLALALNYLTGRLALGAEAANPRSPDVQAPLQATVEVTPTAEQLYLPALMNHPALTPAPAATVTPVATQTTTATATQVSPSPTAVLTPDPSLTQFGLVFVNSAETLSGQARIQRGVDSGAALDRFPLYWTNIERSTGQFDWSTQDAALRADESQGLGVLAILLGTPAQYWPAAAAAGYSEPPPVGGSFLRYAPSLGPSPGPDAGAQASAACTSGGPPAPRDLFLPIFADNTDWPGPGKAVNPANPWARFVDLAVSRYRPGGSAGLHVRHWEIWNEPDLCQFWRGTAAEYARLLKVAYLVIKQRDPEATIIWGGLAHFENGQFLYDLIDALHNDPMAAGFDGFFDGAATHQYSIVWNSYAWTARIRSALGAVGWQDKPIWVTESGVPVCDDYPGPSCPSPWRARPAEQAAYIWQNVAYTRLAGGGPIFQFSLHDDCGNVVDPHSPDGFGLVKNESGSFCSPDGAEKRSAYTAYQLAVRYFEGTTLLWADIQDNVVRRVAFYDPAARERRLMTFSITENDQTARIPAAGAQARRVALDGSETVLTPVNGEYRLTVPGATNRNWPNSSGGYDIGIYGTPYLLVEQDTLPPVTSMGSLPPTSPSSFAVSWQAADLGSGIASVAIWYREDDGAWTLWRDNLASSGTATFGGHADRHYRFAVMATDQAGNHLTQPVVQAETWTTDQVPQVTVNGTVMDVSGQPVVAVPVTVGSMTASTGSAGQFALQVTAGKWDVQVAGQVVIHGQTFSQDTTLALLRPPADDAVANGDFEAGLDGWQAGGSCPLAVELQSGSDDHALHLATAFVANPGVPGEEGSDGGNSTLSQQIQVPAGHPYLALRYRFESQETTAGHDRFEIIVIHGGQADYLHVQQAPVDWRYITFDMGAHAGSSVTLVLNVYQSSPYRPSAATVDLVSVGEPPLPEGSKAPAQKTPWPEP